MFNNSTYKPIQRYEDKAAAYARHRPRYPAFVLQAVNRLMLLQPNAPVADIGSGTGLFTAALLAGGLTVYAVEPNAEMRAEAHLLYPASRSHISVAATAENTNLPPQSLDAVFCAQSFHWFNLHTTAEEFRRILRPGGWIVLLWHEYASELYSFTSDLLRSFTLFCPDYTAYALSDVALSFQALKKYFHARQSHQFEFDNAQQLTADEVIGRTQSLSFCPPSDSKEYAALRDFLEDSVGTHKVNGTVTLKYRLQTYVFQI